MVREMKYRPKIGGGDFDTKTRKVAQFLGEALVKVTIMFRTGDAAPRARAPILDRVAEGVAHLGRVEVMPKQDSLQHPWSWGPRQEGAGRPRQEGDRGRIGRTRRRGRPVADAVEGLRPRPPRPDPGRVSRPTSP